MTAQIMSALINIIGPAIMQSMNKGGKEAKYSSPYTQGQQGAVDKFLSGIPQGQQDITQNQNYQTGSQYLQDMFSDPNFFNKFEAPLQRQFREDTIPNLVRQFAGTGTGGSLNGSDFQNSIAREGRNLTESIAALRGNMMQQNVPNLLSYGQQPTSNVMNQFQAGTGHPLNTDYMPATPGPMGQIAGNWAGSSSGSIPDMINNIFKGFGGNQGQQNQMTSTVGLGQQSPGLSRGYDTYSQPGY